MRWRADSGRRGGRRSPIPTSCLKIFRSEKGICSAPSIRQASSPGSCNPDMVEASLKDTRRDIEKLEAYVEDYYAHSMRIRRILDDTLYAVVARTDLG